MTTHAAASPTHPATPFHVRRMLFDVDAWERRRQGGRGSFVRDMTVIGVATLLCVVASEGTYLLVTGQEWRALLAGTPLVLLVLGVAAPFLTRLAAPLEWRRLETRYAQEMALHGVAAEPAPE
jgi:hypothetical protein